MDHSRYRLQFLLIISEARAVGKRGEARGLVPAAAVVPAQ